MVLKILQALTTQHFLISLKISHPGGPLGIFADFAQSFYELGLQPVPVEPETKICRIYQSDKHFYKQSLTQQQLDGWIRSHGTWDIGIACGLVSGVIGIDFDYDGFSDSDKVEAAIKGILPPSPLIKKGNKGWTAFYKYNDLIKTTCIKRHGDTMLDVLSDGRITVMPPTPHSVGGGVQYRWLTPDTFEDITSNELPELTPYMIDQLREVADDDFAIGIDLPDEPGFKTANNGRYMACFKFVMRASNESESINHLVQELLHFDLKANATDPKGPVFKDPKYLNGNSPEMAARSYVDRWCSWKKAKKAEQGLEWDIGKGDLNFWIEKENGEGFRRSDAYEDYAKFFDAYLATSRLEYITGTLMQHDGMGWKPVENNLKIYESLARCHGLNHAHVEKSFYRWVKGRKRQLLIDIPHWDKKDHLGALLGYVSVKNIPHKHFVDLMKQWCATLWKRVKNSEIQNPCVIFEGEQGMGKDWFINFMLSGLGPYYSEIQLDRSKIENWKSVEMLFACYVPEFDESARIPLSVLKSFITAKSATYRASYGRKAETHDFRHSCISAANFQDILRDSSGNRRFWVFELDSIDWGYRAKVDPQQILAQMVELAKRGYQASDAANAKMKEIISEMTPDDAKELLAEEVRALLDERTDELQKAKFDENVIISQRVKDNEFRVSWDQIGDDIMKIARKYGFGVRTVQSIIKRKGWQYKSGGKRYYM